MYRDTEKYIKNELPDNFWDYGINPILGYRYNPDGKGLPDKIRKLKNENTSIKSQIPSSRE